ncbi:hypothetical protein GJ744_004979 [Endocarpon pusillum]|uniref:Uncharacterized protein n=1 Tax=Endocarpon pusillum TaxID=364733 RepID=A0A8H7DZU8_9EURO|nr:hypothetical protein GJ744_004979 [Endocarpon pusillum]
MFLKEIITLAFFHFHLLPASFSPLYLFPAAILSCVLFAINKKPTSSYLQRATLMLKPRSAQLFLRRS